MTGSDESLVLDCHDLEIERAGATIIRGVSLEVRAGEVTVLLGANGAGKSTLLEGISGLIPCRSGAVTVAGVDVSKSKPRRRSRAGLIHVEQGRTVFDDLTVEENLCVAAPKSEIGRAFDLFPELAPLRKRRSGLLSGGEQQMLVIGRAILCNPKVLLLDEISLGLAPVLVQRLLPDVAALASLEFGILIVEQFAQLALSVGQRAYVLAHGNVTFEGDCADLLKDESLLETAYHDTGRLRSPSVKATCR
ncbi:High-affinity branched-chain amino acid transport ATP-binding protein LivF [Frankia sp. Hr75.2]|nr:High-affinity branched-chain amino acid transport ATP-binding protein LivF [Frankia sp. Hr75.2]